MGKIRELLLRVPGIGGTQAVFERIYTRGHWGEEDGSKFYSGAGSRGRYRDEYLALVIPEIQRLGVRSLADIGCGDFSIGGALAEQVERYIGADIASMVVEDNQRRHGSDRVGFVHLDASRDALPPADAAVIRQVLQHLDNASVAKILEKLGRTYRYVLITEHIHVDSETRPNVEHAVSGVTRLVERSGVRPDKPPYSLPVVLVGDIDYDTDEIMRTWLWTCR